MKRASRIAWLGAAVATSVCLGTSAVASPSRHTLAAKLTVTFSDTKLALSSGHLEAGTATVLVVNRGLKSHTLEIMGPGLKGPRIQKVAAGQRATLTLKLSTGAYELADTRGVSNVRWLVVSPAVIVTGTGNGSVVVPLTDPTRMDCD
jgi:hypothetical protein